MNDLTMGLRIAEERKKLGLSQEALGDKLGVSRQAISKWESDGAVPEIDKLIALSKLFGVSVGWLLGVEEMPEQKQDELSETQLKMVEQIVNRYQDKSASRQSNPIITALAIVGVLLIGIAGLWAVRGRNANTGELAQQITQLQENYSSIRAQLNALNDRLDTISDAAENQEKLLSSYDFKLTELGQTAGITFCGIPKTYNNHTATLRISSDTGAVFDQYACSWDGMNWICNIQLPIENGYEFAFLLNSPDGTQYIQPLDGKYLTALADNIAPTFELSSPIEVERQLGELWVTWIGGQLWMPKLAVDPENLYWEEFSCILYVDGVETDRRSMMPEQDDPYEAHHSFGVISAGSSLMEAPTLYDGMLVEIRLYARLSNGITREFPGGTWLIENGEPVEQTGSR